MGDNREPRSPFFQGRAAVALNRKLARDTWLIRLDCPRLAAVILPGQFLMVRALGTTDPLLGRPFALYDTADDTDGTARYVEIVYLVIGKLTSWLASLQPGDQLEVWGPLGNGFADLPDAARYRLVAGGIGHTPFLAYARFLKGDRGYGGLPPKSTPAEVSFYYGVRSAEFIAVEDFRKLEISVELATDDGSEGQQGTVIDLLRDRCAQSEAAEFQREVWVGCGPEPMLAGLASLAQVKGARCYVSLESPMACGVGICFSCVVPLRTEGGAWDFRRICVDGPVFDAATVAWDIAGM